jgi:hypothetical protein
MVVHQDDGVMTLRERVLVQGAGYHTARQVLHRGVNEVVRNDLDPSDDAKSFHRAGARERNAALCDIDTRQLRRLSDQPLRLGLDSTDNALR